MPTLCRNVLYCSHNSGPIGFSATFWGPFQDYGRNFAVPPRSACHANTNCVARSITLEPFRDPVSTIRGQIYERDAIVDWLRKSATEG